MQYNFNKIAPEICGQNEKVISSRDEYLCIWHLCLLSCTAEAEPPGDWGHGFHVLCFINLHTFLFSQPKV